MKNTEDSKLNKMSKIVFYFQQLISLSKVPAILLFASVLFFACKSPRERQRQPDQVNNTEDLIRNHQNIVKEESDEIDSYISRRKLEMNTTETGLRYAIINGDGSGKKVEDETQVLINYSVALLDGSVVYDSDSIGLLQFKIGKSEVASGLQEGLKLMKEGDKAVFVIPSHLAYGLSGDGDKIKQYQVLVVNVDSLRVVGE